MLLALTRQLPRFTANQAQERWNANNQGMRVLKGKTAVVIGAGGRGVRLRAAHRTKPPHDRQTTQFELMKQGAYFIAVSRGGLYGLDAW